MNFSAAQVAKIILTALTVAGLYYGQKAQTDALAMKLQSVMDAQVSAVDVQLKTTEKLEKVERTTQEIYWTLKAGGIIK